MDRRSFFLLLIFTVMMFFVNNWLFEKPKPKAKPVEVVEAAPLKTAPAVNNNNEKFYVLENDYQQIVFSNIGGAITEINLPFQTSSNPNSIVLPIEFDKLMVQQNPKNASFPLESFFIAGGKDPVHPKEGGYYPLLRRGIAATKNSGSIDISPTFYALNIISDSNEDLAKAEYKVTEFTKSKITFQSSKGGRTITKSFAFAEDKQNFIPYSLNVKIDIEGESRDLSLTSGVPEVEIVSSSPAPAILYLEENKNKLSVEKLKLPKISSKVEKGNINWISNSNGYFGIILNPSIDINTFEAAFVPGVKDPTRLSLIHAQHKIYQAKNYPGYQLEIPFKPSTKSMQLKVFAGPLDQDLLKKADRGFAAVDNGNSPNFQLAMKIHGWFSFISEPFAKFLFVVMKFFYNFTHSWTLSILLLTIVLKVVLYPLNNWSMQSQSKMEGLGSQMKALKARYGQDPKRYNMELMQLYKEKNINPLSVYLIMFLQIPFLIGMFDLLKSAFPLRGASFIPGWIDNLTSPDVLFSWNQPILFFGNSFHLLPFILGGITFFQMWFNSKKNKSLDIDPEAKKQARITSVTMTAVFTVLFYNFPSGLNLYWIFSTILGIMQQQLISKKPKLIGVKK
jgi:YidC/Oxa1 family membrane protein insertase